jgi:hypothetical protein
LLHEHALHALRTHRARQLVLEVARTGVEADALELPAVGAPERAQDVPLLADVVEARDAETAVAPEKARQVSIAAHRHDREALGLRSRPRRRASASMARRSLVSSTRTTPRSCMRESDQLGGERDR